MMVIAKEARAVKILAENHLQTYMEFIAGYKQYKRDKASLYLKAGEAVTHGK